MKIRNLWLHPNHFKEEYTLLSFKYEDRWTRCFEQITLTVLNFEFIWRRQD